MLRISNLLCMRMLCAFVLATGIVGHAIAHEYYGQGFTLVHPWSHATEVSATQAPIYFKLENISGTDKLISAQAPWAETTEIRASGDVSSAAATALPFEPGPDKAFVAGGPHLLLRGLKIQLQWGRSYPMTFVFEKSGSIQVMVSIGAH
jgi:periplasmic copper chaperone A